MGIRPAQSGLKIGGSHLQEESEQGQEGVNDALAKLPRTRPGAKVRDYDAHVLVCQGRRRQEARLERTNEKQHMVITG
jgi:hypothetical protein